MQKDGNPKKPKPEHKKTKNSYTKSLKDIKAIFKKYKTAIPKNPSEN